MFFIGGDCFIGQHLASQGENINLNLATTEQPIVHKFPAMDVVLKVAGVIIKGVDIKATYRIRCTFTDRPQWRINFAKNGAVPDHCQRGGDHLQKEHFCKWSFWSIAISLLIKMINKDQKWSKMINFFVAWWAIANVKQNIVQTWFGSNSTGQGSHAFHHFFH